MFKFEKRQKWVKYASRINWVIYILYYVVGWALLKDDNFDPFIIFCVIFGILSLSGTLHVIMVVKFVKQKIKWYKEIETKYLDINQQTKK